MKSLRLSIPLVAFCGLAFPAFAAQNAVPPQATAMADPAPPPPEVQTNTEPGTDPAAAADPTAEATPGNVPATAEEAIALAREFLGGDERLDSVKSIRMRGSILMEDGSSGDVDIIVQKPMRQHVTITLGPTTEVTALDGYEAWRRVERSGQRAGRELTLLDAEQVRHMRANAFENIAFYKGIEAVRGRIEFLGEAEREGVKCVGVAFIHPRNVRFVRYFNRETGQLVLTETGGRGVIREKGEIRVRGIRFPKELINSDRNATSTVIFSSITLNEEYPASLFQVPIAPSRR